MLRKSAGEAGECVRGDIMALSSLSKIAAAWNIMWGSAYICVAFIAPEIFGDIDFGVVACILLGILILIAVCLLYANMPFRQVGKFLFIILGTVEVFSGVASWTGVVRWNVPFVVVELFQVSMAFMDLISAVFMFVLVLED